MSKPNKPAGPIERLARRAVLGPQEDRREPTDDEIREGVETTKDGEHRG